MGDGVVQIHMISIHSLRVEGDYEELKRQPEDIDFNPLPPCGGRR
ncbi:unknown [Ruminococcus sp. CAG:330]|nr:unknown [Ruminococcus sp. CAG:330]